MPDAIDPIALGVIGLGMAGAVMVYAAANHPCIRLVAAADPHLAARAAFVRDFGGVSCVDAREVCERGDIEAVYIATPHQYHREHAILAADCGKHIVIEKPLALTLEDCNAIIEAIERNRVRLIVGHTHGYDPPVRQMRQLIHSGEVGKLALIAMWNYTNFIYRPRRPEELDSALGGGILFNQIPHQIDTIRVLGGEIASVRAIAACLDPSRPVEGLATAFLQLRNGAAASIVYCGYDRFDSDEFHFWTAESGAPKRRDQHSAAFSALHTRTMSEEYLRTETFGLGARPYVAPDHQPHFGAMIVTCTHADLRASRDGVLVYDRSGVREIALEKCPGTPGRNEVLDDLYVAIRYDCHPLHDAHWGKSTVAAVLALKASALHGRETAIE